MVISVTSDSGAAKAGLQKGDIITKINGEEVQNGAYLRYELYQHQAGDTIEVTYIRDNKEQTTQVTLGKSSSY